MKLPTMDSPFGKIELDMVSDGETFWVYYNAATLKINGVEYNYHTDGNLSSQHVKVYAKAPQRWDGTKQKFVYASEAARNKLGLWLTDNVLPLVLDQENQKRVRNEHFLQTYEMMYRQYQNTLKEADKLREELQNMAAAAPEGCEVTLVVG